MKRLVGPVALVGILIVSSPAAYGGLVCFGARAGYDFTTLDREEVANFTLGTGTATIVREEIDRPLVLGATVETGVFPFCALEIAGEVAFKRYHFDYTGYSAAMEVLERKSDDVYFARLSALVTVKRNLVSFPPIMPVLSVYAGVGGGLHFVTPLVGRSLIVDKLDEPADPLDPEEIVEYEFKPAGHGLVGAKLKPAVLPFALSGEARYVVKAEGDYGEPGSHWSGYVGLALGF